MIQISGQNSRPLEGILPKKVTKIFSPLSKNEGLRDNEHIISIGNLIYGVNSVTASYLICYLKFIKKCDRYYYKIRQLIYYKIRQKFLTKRVRFFITNCNSYYKMQRLLQTATIY